MWIDEINTFFKSIVNRAFYWNLLNLLDQTNLTIRNAFSAAKFFYKFVTRVYILNFLKTLSNAATASIKIWWDYYLCWSWEKINGCSCCGQSFLEKSLQTLEGIKFAKKKLIKKDHVLKTWQEIRIKQVWPYFLVLLE